MKPYQRRASGTYPYYKLATWDARSMVWRDGKVAYQTVADAVDAISGPGKYRLSRVDDSGRRDFAPFTL